MKLCMSNSSCWFVTEGLLSVQVCMARRSSEAPKENNQLWACCKGGFSEKACENLIMLSVQELSTEQTVQFSP